MAPRAAEIRAVSSAAVVQIPQRNTKSLLIQEVSFGNEFFKKHVEFGYQFAECFFGLSFNSTLI